MKSAKYLLLAGALGALLVAYQNCGPGMPLEADLEQNSVEANAPFAYEISMDQISYMSCRQGFGDYKDNIDDPDAFYSFRMGAHGTKSGVRLSSEFLGYADTHFDPPYGADVPAGQATPDQILSLLQESPANIYAQPQVALRMIPNVRTDLITNESNAIIADADYHNLVQPLTDYEIAYEMAQAQRGSWFNYFSGGTGLTNRSLISSLHFQRLAEKDFYRTVEDRAVLAAGFTMDHREIKGKNFEIVARGPQADSTSLAYGKGFRLGFALGDAGETEALRDGLFRVLDSVDEVDLSVKNGGPTSSQWQCPTSLRFVIVHPEDEATACPNENFGALTNQEKQNREIALRHLNSADWKINIRQRCVVPRKGTCYSHGREINYRYTASSGKCDEYDSAKRACAHYVSMCTRL